MSFNDQKQQEMYMWLSKQKQNALYHFLLQLMTFWNSLIIHHIKTKKIATVKEVWITGLN